MSFTQVMLSRYAADIELATQAPFLRLAGEHALGRDVLSEWLTQDKMYAFEGYPKFIAHLITSLDLKAQDSRETLSLLSFALTNIVRETGFFDSLGPRYGLNLTTSVTSTVDGGAVQSAVVNPTTKAYIDTMLAQGAGRRLDEGLVLLWAMEKLYLESWRFAARQTPIEAPEDQLISAALAELIGNWTSAEFVSFVDACENEVAKLDIKEGTDAWRRCEEIVKYVIWLEQRFWPAV